MQRIFKVLIASLAAFGLAAGAVSAHAADTKADAKKPAAAPKAEMKKEAPKAEAPKAEAAKGEPMDINSASEKDLASLKGIGDVRAKAIIKHRPYKGKDDLVKKKIIPKKVYDEIKDEIIAKQK